MVAQEEELDCAEILITIKLKFLLNEDDRFESHRKGKMTFLVHISLNCKSASEGMLVIERMIRYQRLLTKSISVRFIKILTNGLNPEKDKED